MNKLTKKSLLLVKICNFLLAEEMDRIKGTTAYKQGIKNMVNNLSKRLDKECEETYNLYQEDERGEMGLNYSIKIIEDFVDKLVNLKSAEEFIIVGEKLKTL
jgi:hypothetical protein